MLVRRYGRVELLRVFRYMNSSVSGGAFPLRGAPPPPSLVLGALGLGTEIDLDGFREAVGRSGLGARVSFRLGDCPSGYLPLENRLGRIRGGGRVDRSFVRLGLYTTPQWCPFLRDRYIPTSLCVSTSGVYTLSRSQLPPSFVIPVVPRGEGERRRC